MDEHHILHHLDDPLRLLKWTIDEALIMILPILLLGVGLGEILLGSIVGFGGFSGLRFLKKRFGKKILRPLLYWYLPSHSKFKSFPKSHIREFIG